MVMVALSKLVPTHLISPKPINSTQGVPWIDELDRWFAIIISLIADDNCNDDDCEMWMHGSYSTMHCNGLMRMKVLHCRPPSQEACDDDDDYDCKNDVGDESFIAGSPHHRRRLASNSKTAERKHPYVTRIGIAYFVLNCFVLLQWWWWIWRIKIFTIIIGKNTAKAVRWTYVGRFSVKRWQKPERFVCFSTKK